MPEQRLPQHPAPAPPRHRWGANQLVIVVNGVIASTTGAYLITRSAAVTLAVALLAVGLAGWLALLDR